MKHQQMSTDCKLGKSINQCANACALKPKQPSSRGKTDGQQRASRQAEIPYGTTMREMEQQAGGTFLEPEVKKSKWLEGIRLETSQLRPPITNPLLSVEGRLGSTLAGD